MAVSVGHQRSDTKVIQGGLVWYEQLLAGGAVTPGALVKRGADDDHVVEAGDGANDVLGVADYIAHERVTGTRGGQVIGTDIAADQPLRVAKGNFLWRGTLKSGENVVKGDRLVCAANGEVKKAATLSVTVPSGATAVTSDAAQPNLVEAGSLMPGGGVIAIAEESVNATSEAKPILLRYMGGV